MGNSPPWSEGAKSRRQYENEEADTCRQFRPLTMGAETPEQCKKEIKSYMIRERLVSPWEPQWNYEWDRCVVMVYVPTYRPRTEKGKAIKKEMDARLHSLSRSATTTPLSLTSFTLPFFLFSFQTHCRTSR